jgi:hypothetical protein
VHEEIHINDVKEINQKEEKISIETKEEFVETNPKIKKN